MKAATVVCQKSYANELSASTNGHSQHHPLVLTRTINWSGSFNFSAVYRKDLRWLSFLGRLRSFTTYNKRLQMFDQYAVASTVILAVMCRGADFKAQDTNRLNKLINEAGSVVGHSLSLWKRWWRRIEAEEQPQT